MCPGEAALVATEKPATRKDRAKSNIWGLRKVAMQFLRVLRLPSPTQILHRQFLLPQSLLLSPLG